MGATEVFCKRKKVDTEMVGREGGEEREEERGREIGKRQKEAGGG